MKIPYAALRFANREDATWGIQFFRKFRKEGLDYSWNSIDRTVGNEGLYDGLLKGLNNISPPTRLMFYPFTSFTAVSEKGKIPINNVGFGMDLKYGITESFTLDATLIPDFGQTAFDDLVLNLGPFEQEYQEQRPFFTEGANIFNYPLVAGQGWSMENLFYSRRIGRSPQYYPEIVVSNTFTQEWEMEQYFKLAEEYGYMVFTIIVENINNLKCQKKLSKHSNIPAKIR